MTGVIPPSEAHLLTLARHSVRIRMDIIEQLAAAGSGHPGGSLSAADLLTALYFDVLRHDPARPDWPGRDIFLLSKGHITPGYYAALARAGYFPPQELLTFRKLHTRLQGHPAKNKGLPGVEVSSGSLGQGLSIGVGMALAFKHLDGDDRRVYVLMGDGEQQEGSVWEAAMAAAHYGLTNLCAIVDNNGLQIDGPVASVMNIEPLADKWRAFGWTPIPCDGHDMGGVLDAFTHARRATTPAVVIARTVKGKGVSFMEHAVGWHGKAPNAAEAAEALAELSAEDRRLAAALDLPDSRKGA